MVNIPVLLFCIAFGLSMDYEVFLVSRIREFWLNSDRSQADNDESVALGLAHTGRVITAAALVMCISFAALIATMWRLCGCSVSESHWPFWWTRRSCAWCYCPRSCIFSAGGTGGHPGHWRDCTPASASARALAIRCVQKVIQVTHNTAASAISSLRSVSRRPLSAARQAR